MPVAQCLFSSVSTCWRCSDVSCRSKIAIWFRGGAESCDQRRRHAVARGSRCLATPISDPYRAGYGALCRDVRQALTRADDIVVQAVSLCREESGLGGTLWVAAHWP